MSAFSIIPDLNKFKYLQSGYPNILVIQFLGDLRTAIPPFACLVYLFDPLLNQLILYLLVDGLRLNH